MGTIAIDYQRISRAAGIYSGEPSIKGSKIPVSIIAGYYQMGMSEAEILQGFPPLEPADIQCACILFR